MVEVNETNKGIARTRELEEIPEEQLDIFQNTSVEQTHNMIRQIVRALTPEYEVLFVELGSIEAEEDTSDDPPFDPEEEY